jgi:type VI protein secretion system component VasK
MEKIKNWLILGAVFFLITIMPCFLTSAGAAFYKYTDRNGTVHFTDRYESIPQEYRDQVKTLREETKPQSPAPPSAGQEKKKESEPAAGEQAGKAQETRAKETEAIEARKKETEDRKLKAFEEKEKRIEELQKQIEDKQKQQKSLRTNWMVQDRNIIIKLNQEIADLEKQIKVIQNELAEGK